MVHRAHMLHGTHTLVRDSCDAFGGINHMNRMPHLSTPGGAAMAVALAITSALACSSPEGLPCEDHARVDAVFYESGLSVVDTIGARLVFEDYVAHVEESGEYFPDGAERWVLDRVGPSPWDEAPWVVFYFPLPGDGFTSQVHVDGDGRVVRLVIAVHAPC